MPEISDEQFRVMAEIQGLARVMKRCASMREPEFQQAQAALTMALNRLSSLPTLRDRSAARPPAGQAASKPEADPGAGPSTMPRPPHWPYPSWPQRRTRRDRTIRLLPVSAGAAPQ